MKDTFTNREDLTQSIKRHIPDITQSDTKGFYRQRAKYYKQAALGLPFKGKPLDPEIFEAVNAATLPEITDM